MHKAFNLSCSMQDRETLRVLLSDNQAGPDLAAAHRNHSPSSGLTALANAVAYGSADDVNALFHACR